MKKIIAAGLLALLTAGVAQAQTVYGYSVTQSDGTYTPLSAPTEIFNSSMTADDSNFELKKTLMTPAGLQTANGSYVGYDLGFTLNIAGETFTKFAVSGSGYVLLGNEDINFNPNLTANFLTFGSGFNIAGMTCTNGIVSGTDSKVSYKVSGSGNGECLTVQFEKVGIMVSMWDDPTAYQDFQIKLYKDGRMELVFNNFRGIEAGKTVMLVMGIRLNDYFVCANGEPGNLGINRISRETVNYGNTTANGTTVTFNVPGPCVKPTAQPTELKLAATTSTLEGSFTPCEGADTYLVAYATGDNTPAVPVDKTMYAAGDKIGENTTVAYFGDKTKFDLLDLLGSTKYNFAVYAANTYGLDGPQYNVTAPLSMSVQTAPLGAKSAEMLASTSSEISLKVQSNEADDNIVVVYTTFCDRTIYGSHGLFGAIPADVKVGDVLALPESYDPESVFPGENPATNGGTVAYVGKAIENPIVISGLQPSTLYYVGVYTMDANGNVCADDLPNQSKQIIYTGSFTVIENPWDGNTAYYPNLELPYTWKTAEGDYTVPAFRDENFIDYKTHEISRGTQAIQLCASIQRGDAVNGKEVWVTAPPWTSMTATSP